MSDSEGMMDTAEAKTFAVTRNSRYAPALQKTILYVCFSDLSTIRLKHQRGGCRTLRGVFMLSITIIICITAVVMCAMVCSTKQNQDREQTIIKEITKNIIEKKGENDGL